MNILQSIDVFYVKYTLGYFLFFFCLKNAALKILIHTCVCVCVCIFGKHTYEFVRGIYTHTHLYMHVYYACLILL